MRVSCGHRPAAAQTASLSAVDVRVPIEHRDPAPAATTMIDWKSTLRTSLAGIRRNALPGLALQAFALVLVLAYHFVPALGPSFERVATLKSTYGYAYSAISTALFGGFIPFLYLLLARRIAPTRRLAEGIFYVLFWAYKGMEVDLFYRLQAHWFGNDPTVGTIACKVAVDQFGYSVLVAGPSQMLAFLWKDKGFHARALLPYLSPSTFIPTLATVVLSNWMVWMPGVSIIYCLPLPLQIPLSNLVLCFWVLLLSFVSKSSEGADRRPQNDEAPVIAG
jgi:hypothetical protein